MLNKDIDYARTLESPHTLDVDFTDDALTDTEEAIFALSANLYGQEVFRRIPTNALRPSANGLSGAQATYMDARAIVAKLSVAENSFNAITGLKSAGAPGAKEFMDAVFEQLGVEEEQVSSLIGEQPSYYAQMEVLTKVLLQNPDFFTNLYDKPANVKRKGAALQAIGLMQKFDLFKSHLRNEANLSVLLELAVKDLQDEIENQINENSSGGTAPIAN